MTPGSSMHLHGTQSGFLTSAAGAFVFLLAAAIAWSQQATGSVSGTVIDANAQRPLAGVIVVLQGIGQTTSDKDGRFSFHDVRPGRFPIQAIRTGMAAPLRDRGANTVTMGPGEEVRNVRLSLAPFGVIRGRVTDENGNPVSGARVELFEVEYQRGRRVLVPPSMAVGTLLMGSIPSTSTDCHRTPISSIFATAAPAFMRPRRM